MVFQQARANRKQQKRDIKHPSLGNEREFAHTQQDDSVMVTFYLHNLVSLGLPCSLQTKRMLYNMWKILVYSGLRDRLMTLQLFEFHSKICSEIKTEILEWNKKICVMSLDWVAYENVDLAEARKFLNLQGKQIIWILLWNRENNEEERKQRTNRKNHQHNLWLCFLIFPLFIVMQRKKKILTYINCCIKPWFADNFQGIVYKSPIFLQY